MFAPLDFAVFLLGILLYSAVRRRQVVRDAIRRGGWTAEVLTQPCLIFYAFLAWMSFHSDWVYAGDTMFGLLDPRISVLKSTLLEMTPPMRPAQALCEVFREKHCQQTVCRGGVCYRNEIEQCVQAYPDACSLLEIPRALRWLTLLSPPCVILALCISVLHTSKHMMFGRPWCAHEMDLLHDYAVQICALAPVYGLFSLISVVHMVVLLEGRTNTILFTSDRECMQQLELHGREHVSRQCWSDYIDRSQRWYDLNFLVADLYEARALYCFTKLCMEYLDLQTNKRGLFATSCFRCNARCPECQGENTVVSHILLLPLKQMTMLGVTCFVWTNFFRSMLMLAMEVMRLWYPAAHAYVLSILGQLGDTDAAMAGFTLCVSSIAIWNLVTFERHLKDPLHDFAPMLKFLSAKVIVSLAFMQEIVLDIVGKFVRDPNWSNVQHRLGYSSLMSVEILFVAILQYQAWRPAALESIASFRKSRSALFDVDIEDRDQVKFQISRGDQRLQLQVAEISIDAESGKKVFWESAAVTLLSNGGGK